MSAAVLATVGFTSTAVLACLDQTGPIPCYVGPPPSGGGGGGLSSGEIAGISVGAAGAAYGLWWFLVGSHKSHDGDEEKPDGAQGQLLHSGARATEARLVPQGLVLRPGEQCFFQLQVRAGAKEAWRPVTALPGASIEVVGEHSLLTRVSGCRNGFCLPVTENRVKNGYQQVVRGVLAVNGGRPLIAESAVRIAPDDEMHPSLGSISPCSGSIER